MNETRDADSTVLKEPSSRPIALLAWLGCLIPVVWHVSTSAWEALGVSAPWILLVAWVVYTVLWLPRLVIRPDGLTVVNGLRTYWIPFSVMEEVKVRQSVSIHAAGRKIVSWGAPMPRGAMSAGREVFAGSGVQTVTPGNDRLRAATAVDPSRERIAKALDKARAARTRRARSNRDPMEHLDGGCRRSRGHSGSGLFSGAVTVGCREMKQRVFGVSVQ